MSRKAWPTLTLPPVTRIGRSAVPGEFRSFRAIGDLGSIRQHRVTPITCISLARRMGFHLPAAIRPPVPRIGLTRLQRSQVGLLHRGFSRNRLRPSLTLPVPPTWRRFLLSALRRVRCPPAHRPQAARRRERRRRTRITPSAMARARLRPLWPPREFRLP